MLNNTKIIVKSRARDGNNVIGEYRIKNHTPIFIESIFREIRKMYGHQTTYKYETDDYGNEILVFYV